MDPWKSGKTKRCIVIIRFAQQCTCNKVEPERARPTPVPTSARFYSFQWKGDAEGNALEYSRDRTFSNVAELSQTHKDFYHIRRFSVRKCDRYFRKMGNLKSSVLYENFHIFKY